jgi:hypothetical protein
VLERARAGRTMTLPLSCPWFEHAGERARGHPPADVEGVLCIVEQVGVDVERRRGFARVRLSWITGDKGLNCDPAQSYGRRVHDIGGPGDSANSPGAVPPKGTRSLQLPDQSTSWVETLMTLSMPPSCTCSAPSTGCGGRLQSSKARRTKVPPEALESARWSATASSCAATRNTSRRDARSLDKLGWCRYGPVQVRTRPSVASCVALARREGRARKTSRFVPRRVIHAVQARVGMNKPSGVMRKPSQGTRHVAGRRGLGCPTACDDRDP